MNSCCNVETVGYGAAAGASNGQGAKPNGKDHRVNIGVQIKSYKIKFIIDYSSLLFIIVKVMLGPEHLSAMEPCQMVG